MAGARRFLSCLTTLAVCCGWAASTASGAFPGRNGLLAAEPVTGGGLVLLTPSGTGIRRICGDATLCAVPAHPRWSPNGLAIAFAGSASRPGIVAPDGSCLWCMLGPALTTVHGRAPEFTADGQSITLTGASGGVWRATLSSSVTSRALRGGASDVAWSSTGELAIVRGGTIWLRARGRSTSLHRLVAGTGPSFSPEGSELAIAHAGWISITAVRGGTLRRLVRGSAPAWSPDGREIAYIARDGGLRIFSVRSHRSRSLGIQARSVDWQPITSAGSRSCTPTKGWQVIARDADALIASAPGDENAGSFGGWYGCLKAVNKWRLLLQGSAEDAGYDTTIDRAALAGRFALLASSYEDKYQNCSHSLAVDDLATGATAPLPPRTAVTGAPTALPSAPRSSALPGLPPGSLTARSRPTNHSPRLRVLLPLSAWPAIRRAAWKAPPIRSAADPPGSCHMSQGATP